MGLALLTLMGSKATCLDVTDRPKVDAKANPLNISGKIPVPARKFVV